MLCSKIIFKKITGPDDIAIHNNDWKITGDTNLNIASSIAEQRCMQITHLSAGLTYLAAL